MPAPIAVELVADPPPAPDVARALVEACSGASGPGGCVFEPRAGETTARARVVVTFAAQDARAHVEAQCVPSVDPGGSGSHEIACSASREVAFRESDPPAERYRAAGLVAAGLVSELEAREADRARSSEQDARDAEVGVRTPNPPYEDAPAPSRPAPAAVVVRLGGGVGWDAGRPWALAELGGDFTVASLFFLALSANYGQTWSADPEGIADHRVALALGAGATLPLAPQLIEVRIRAELLVNELRASIRQPSTGREDEGDRTLAGGRAEIDLDVPLGSLVGAFAGARIDYLGGRTTVRVQDTPRQTLEPWLPSVAAGLTILLR